MNILEAMTDPKLFGNQFAGDSWRNWRTLLAGFYGLPICEDDAQTWRELTGRETFPIRPHDALVLVIGRRGGKSQQAALIAVYEGLFNDHASKLAPGEVATILIVAADRKQARTVMRYIRGLLVENPMLSRLVVREDRESIELANRCVIEIGTASFRSTRGYTMGCFIADEVAFWRSDDSASPDREIINAVTPGLATLGGKLIALSSPYARRGWLWDTYRTHFGKDSRILVAQAPTLLMNPSLGPDIVREAYEADPASAAAEYGAQFRTDVESFVALEVLEACTRPSCPEIMPDSGTRYSAFVDPSGGSADAFALAIAHLDKQTGVAIIDAIRAVRPPFSPESVVQDFCDLLRAYRIHEVHGDAYAGLWPSEQFAKRGIRYKKADKTKSELYRDLLPLMNSGKIELPPDRQLFRELLGLERRTSRGGRDSIDHAPNAHDDLANAVAGAAVYAKQPEPIIVTNIRMAC